MNYEGPFVSSGNERHEQEYSRIHQTNARRAGLGRSPEGLVEVSRDQVAGVRVAIYMSENMKYEGN